MHGPAPRWYVDRCLCVVCVAGGGGKGGELSRKSNQRVRSHRPAGTLRVLAFLLQGGGISVGSGGVANLNGCQVNGPAGDAAVAQVAVSCGAGPPPSPNPPPTLPPPSSPPPSPLLPSPPVSPLAAPTTEYVEDHNIKRQLHETTTDLVYDADLAAASQAYAESCPTGHGQDLDNLHSPNGENLYWAGSSGAAPDTSYNTAVEAWYNEITDYTWPQNYQDPRSNGGVVGHFTQVVWKASTKVGCGKYTGCINKFGSGFTNSAVVCRCARLPRLPPPHCTP